MRIWQGGCRIKPWIGYPVHTHASVVIGNILNEPFNGVVGIGAFVNIIWVGWIITWNVGAHIVKRTITHITATHILVGQDVSIPDQKV